MYGGGYHYESPGLRTVAVVKTTDGWFQDWTVTSLSAHSGYIYALAIDPGNSDIIYAGGQYHDGDREWCVGLFKSTDFGESWTEITRNEGLPQGMIGKIGVAVSPPAPWRVWALVEAEDGGVFRSDDGGMTWTRTNEERKLRQRAFYYTRIYADTKDPDV